MNDFGSIQRFLSVLIYKFVVEIGKKDSSRIPDMASMGCYFMHLKGKAMQCQKNEENRHSIYARRWTCWGFEAQTAAPTYRQMVRSKMLSIYKSVLRPHNITNLLLKALVLGTNPWTLGSRWVTSEAFKNGTPLSGILLCQFSVDRQDHAQAFWVTSAWLEPDIK